ncbi:FAD-binding oxidoreductase [Nocardioides cynanchi]|uniref:FAD-binding oxidoreductase n=1 Tax=Nocardioides cynanchi TaxID=2558918 RepID=UPI00177D5489|nr:FAD-binding oxidoreductase [Nocardioides cynanchi]
MTTRIDQPFTAADLSGLRSACTGPVLTPDQPGYADEVATWNLSVRLRPAVVVGAAGPDDVVAAVRWATERGLAIGVNATGHGAVPNADGALLVSTRRMTSVRVDPVLGTATVAAGARMRDVTAAAAPYGLAPVQGSTGSAGAVGYTLGGGLGVMSRTFGLAVDHVTTIDVVTLDGRLRTVDADHDADLFWALRGGRGNFGVVTSYRTMLQRLSTFYGGGLFFDGADAGEVLHRYRAWIADHSDRTSSSVALLRLPPDPRLPEPIRGRFVAHLRMAHVGEPEEGSRLAGAMRASAPVLLETLGRLPTTALDAVHLDPVDPMPTHERGLLLDDLAAGVVEAVLARAGGAVEHPLVVTDLRNLGGAIARPPERPSAVPGRDAAALLFTLAPAVPPLAEAGPRAVQALFDAVEPWRSTSTLPSFLGRSFRPADVQGAWPQASLDRLLAVKGAWDPANQLRVGHALLGADDVG